MRTLLLAAVTVFSVATHSWAADEPKAIVEKAIKATGGADKLDKFLGHRATMKGTIDTMGMTLEMTAKSVGEYPDKVKVEGKISVSGQEIALTQLANGKTVSMNVNGMNIDLPPEALEDIQYAMYATNLTRLTPLLKADVTLKAAPDADVDGKPAAGVLVSTKGKVDCTLYFDKKTNLLVRMSHKSKSPTGEVDRDKYFSDYKEVSGVQIPHTAVTKDDGKVTQQFKVSNYELLEKVDGKEFKAKDD